MELGNYILYDTNEQKIIWENNEPYTVDGENPTLPAHILSLQKVFMPVPQHDPDTQVVTQNIYIDEPNGHYVQDYTVRDKTQYELDMDDWGYPMFVKRIVAPMAMITDSSDHTGVKFFTWFQAQGLPVEKEGDNMRLYCNTILPQHQSLVNAYKNTITIEDIPDPNNY